MHAHAVDGVLSAVCCRLCICFIKTFSRIPSFSLCFSSVFVSASSSFPLFLYLPSTDSSSFFRHPSYACFILCAHCLQSAVGIIPFTMLFLSDDLILVPYEVVCHHSIRFSPPCPSLRRLDSGLCILYDIDFQLILILILPWSLPQYCVVSQLFVHLKSIAVGPLPDPHR